MPHASWGSFVSPRDQNAKNRNSVGLVQRVSEQHVAELRAYS